MSGPKLYHLEIFDVSETGVGNMGGGNYLTLEELKAALLRHTPDLDDELVSINVWQVDEFGRRVDPVGAWPDDDQ